MKKTGVLLINLGTPSELTVSSVRRYLREFLTDPRVIDLPLLLRYFLVFCVILPFRPFKTVKAYRKIWRESGSPLRIYTDLLQAALSEKLGSSYTVAAAMRYGEPSIQLALTQLSDCAEIIILPLFPQYSSAATGSAMAKALTEISKQWSIPKITVIDNFYNDKHFINAYAETIRPHLGDKTFLLLSYHGLPERHLDKSQCRAACDRLTACPALTIKNQFCYRAQCYQTTRLITKTLGLNENQYSSSFQSRLGRIPWIKPYTDAQFKTLRSQGINDLVVVCPSFVADCLETLEEIAIQGKADWQALGGRSFKVVPCLNDDAAWVTSLVEMIHHKDKTISD